MVEKFILMISLGRKAARRIIQLGREATSAVAASSFGRHVRLYAGQRTANAVLFAVSLVLLGVLVYLFRDATQLQTPHTDINMITQGSTLDIVGVWLAFDYGYGEEGQDRLLMRINIRNRTGESLAGKYLLLNMSRNFRYAGRESFTTRYVPDTPVRYHQGGYDVNKQSFTFLEGTSVEIWEEYIGDFFGNQQMELSFDLNLSAYQSGEVPIEVLLRGLDDVKLDRLSPRPYDTTENIPRFLFTSFGEPPGAGVTISMSGTDSRAAHAGQFQVFLLGAFIAIVTSAAVNILTDFTSFVPRDETERQ